MDCNRFQQACRQARESLRGQNGIGTLGEKTLHAALKAYYEPDAESHEIKIGRYIAISSEKTELLRFKRNHLISYEKNSRLFIRHPRFCGLPRGSCKKTLMD